MAYHCKTCRIVFDRKYSNCHICGYGLQSDDRPVREYVDMGYELAGRERPALSRPQVDDGDILSNLRSGYQREHRQEGPVRETGVETGERILTGDQDFFAAAGNSTGRTARPDTVSPRTASADEDFFARDHQSERRTVKAADQRKDIAENSAAPQLAPVHPPRRSSFCFGNLWHGFLNGVNRIPWAAVLRIILIGLLIWGLAALWNARFLILDSILGFLSVLLPTVLTIILMIYLIRCLSR